MRHLSLTHSAISKSPFLMPVDLYSQYMCRFCYQGNKGDVTARTACLTFDWQCNVPGERLGNDLNIQHDKD